MKRNFYYILKASVFTLLATVFIENSFAQSTWEGTKNTAGLLGNVAYWENGDNWNSVTIPTNTTSTIFGALPVGPPAGSSTVFVGQNNLANSMTFNSAVGFTFTGDTIAPLNTTITLGNSGANSNPFIRNSSTGNQQINLGVSFSGTATGTRTIENSSSGSLTFGVVNAVNSTVTNPTGTLSVTNSGPTGTITFNGAVNVGSNGPPVVNGSLAISNSSSGNVTFNSSVNTTNGITKTGIGTVVFNGAVSAGAPGITVSSGRLEGVGTVSGVTNIESGARYSAGVNGIGTQTFTSALSFQDNTSGNANFAWDLQNNANPTPDSFDRVFSNGGLNIGTGFRTQINLLPGSPVQVGDSWDVFTGSTISGINAINLGLGTFVTSGTPAGISFQWSVFNGNVGRITAVPEPSSMALLGMAGLIGGVYARRRAKKNKA